MLRFRLAALALSIALPAVAQAATAIDYNVFVSGNFTATGSDVEGRVAAGGNIAVGAYAIGEKATGSGYVAVAGGTFNATGGGSANGSTIAGSYAGYAAPGQTQFTISGARDSYAAGAASPVDITGEASRLSALSQSLASSPATYGTVGTVEREWNQLWMVGSGSGVNVFTVSASDLANNYGIHIAIPVGALAVVNVSGTSGGIANTGSDSQVRNGTSVNFQVAGYNAANVLYNFYQATSLSPAGSVNASILAMAADVSTNGGVIQGQVFAKSYSGNTQVNYVPTNASALLAAPQASAVSATAAVPEPGTWALLILGFGAVGWSTRRSRRAGIAIHL